VFTCFPRAASTTGKTASEKMDDDAVKTVDKYVVLHANDDGTFGVGVNDLNENGTETDYGKSAPAKAKNA